MRRPYRFKRALVEGRVAIGTCVDSYSPAVVEVAGYSGLDFVRIDTEYSWRRDDALEHMIRAAIISEVTPMVRVEKGNPYLVSKALQVGAGAIVVSDIATYQEALEVVRSAKFPPKGVRGYSSFSFSGGWGAYGGRDWIKWSETEIPVGIMVENQEIIGHLDEIFAIEGLDFGLFGPADYSMSIGLGAPQADHPKVKKALERAIASARKNGKAIGIGIGPPWEENARRYLQMGCTFLELGHDLAILRNQWQSAASVIHSVTGAGP